jgi:hypothetical protein
MAEITEDTKALRQKGVEMLSTLEDRKLLEHVVNLIQQSYLEEIVEYERDGTPLSRAALLESLKKGMDDIANGKGISGEEMSRRIRQRFQSN